MGYSAKIKIDSQRPRSDGTCAIFMQIIIDRKKRRLDLGIRWPASRFNDSDHCLKRHREDPDVEVYNAIIRNARSKADAIHRNFLLMDVPLTLEAFNKEYDSRTNRRDFIAYMDGKSYEQWNKGIINNTTRKNEKTVVQKLKLFVWKQNPENASRNEPDEITESTLPFNLFHNMWAREFDLFLKRRGCSHNTRWGYHKIVIKYLNMAMDPGGQDKIMFVDPYSKFKNTAIASERGPLTVDQLKTLLNMYIKWRDNPLPVLSNSDKTRVDNRDGLTGREVVVLRKFLFSCNSSLRISDLQNLDETQFENGEISITPQKTESYGTKIKSVPLNSIALMLLKDEKDFVKQQMSDKPYIKIQRTRGYIVRIFETYCDQATNRYLKRIATKAKINSNLHMHVGRYTFGSLSDEAGANHTALMQQMGIRKRETLEKYVKTNRKSIERNVSKFEDLVDADISKNPANQTTSD